MIQRCEAVYKSATEPHSFVIKIALKIDGQNVILPVLKEESNAFGLSYRVKSIYSKPDCIFSLWISAGLEIYRLQKVSQETSGELSPL